MSRTILVTGANRGIGLELTKQYLFDGDRVIACCRQPDQALQLQTLSNDFPDQLSIHRLDVTSEISISSLVHDLGESARIDVLINNAGIYGPKAERGTGMEEFAGPALNDILAGDWLEVMHVNTIAPLMVTRRILPLMQGGEKKIIMISTMMSSIHDKDYGGAYIYSSSKTALNMVGKTLANDLTADGFTVSMIHPGWVQTDMGGPNADTTVKGSASGIREVISELAPELTGSFFNFDGTRREW